MLAALLLLCAPWMIAGEMRVKKTSHAAAIPKGVTRIPRELVGELTVRWKQGKGRVLLTTAMVFAGRPLLAALNAQADEIGVGGSLALLSGFAVAGYLVGDRIDAKRMRVVIVPMPSPPDIGTRSGSGVFRKFTRGGNPSLSSGIARGQSARLALTEGRKNR